MILWTLQAQKAWDTLQKTGKLQSRAQYATPDFLPAYRWMATQMEKRIGPRPDSPAAIEVAALLEVPASLESPDIQGCMPLWAWYQWRNEKKRKPDLRHKGHLSKGEPGVRIEFEIDEKDVLLSDFDLWHYVLNYWYLPASESDDESFEKELASQGLSLKDITPSEHQVLHTKVVDSWNRIFDLEWEDEYITYNKAEKSIQATLWELRLEQVKKVEFFTAK